MADRGLRYVALDFGAESGRTIVGRFDGDQLSIEPVHRYANTPVRMGGTLYWDFARQFHDILAGMGKAAEGGPVALGLGRYLGRGLRLHRRARPAHGQPGPLPRYAPREHARGGLRHGPARRDLHGHGHPVHVHQHALPAAQRGPGQGPHPGAGRQAADDAGHLQPLPVRRRRGRVHRGHAPARRWTPGRTTGRGRSSTAWASPPTSCRRSWSPARSWVGCSTRSPRRPAARRPGRGRRLARHALGGGSHPAGRAVDRLHLVGHLVAGRPGGQRRRWSTQASLAANLTNEGGYGGTITLLRNVMGLWLVQQSRKALWPGDEAPSYAEICDAGRDRAPPARAFVDPDDSRFLWPGDMPTRIREFCDETRTAGARSRRPRCGVSSSSRWRSSTTGSWTSWPR